MAELEHLDYEIGDIIVITKTVYPNNPIKPEHREHFKKEVQVNYRLINKYETTTSSIDKWVGVWVGELQNITDKEDVRIMDFKQIKLECKHLLALRKV